MSPPPSISAVADCPPVAERVPEIPTPRTGAPARDATFAAIGLALLSTIFFAMGDVAAKVLTGTLPAIEVAWLRYLIFCLVVVPTVFVARGARVMHTPRLRLQIIRALAVAGSAVLFILGLGHLQVAEATAINFISPIFITALSIPLLGEKVGIRRWAAAAVGFLGVMLVVQPGGAAFQVAALLPIGAALAWAVAAIATRLMSLERPEATLAWSAVIGLIALTAFVPFHWRTPTAGEIGLAVLMGTFSTTGHWLIILAYRKAAASTIAPYVDGPLLARVLNRILDRIVCGHMSGLLLRSHLTAAKMASATRVPNKLAACHCRGAMRSFACLGSIDHTICSCSCKSGIRSARESCGLFPCPTDLYPAHATSVDAACAR
jgi:drug/metabolite transporter (DMT)-like permease